MKILRILGLLIIFAVMNGCEKKKYVDTIVYNAVVYTVNDAFEKTSAFAIKNGQFVAFGESESMLQKFGAVNYVDAGGRAIYPGFNDGHSHFIGYGLSVTAYVDLVGTKSFEEVIEKVKAHHTKYPSEWIYGRGWDQNDWLEKQFPTKEKLDEAFPDTPVVLRRIDGHALIANTEAMNRAGITSQSFIEGGEILKKDGKITGIFIDNAMDLVEAVIPEPTNEQLVRAVKKGQEDCFKVGLTTVTDAGLSKDRILLIQQLQEEGLLDIRVYAMISPDPENIDYFFSRGPHKTDKLAVSSVKLYIDGALGSRGALLIKPYSDDPGNYGLQLSPEMYYNEICQQAYDAGFQVNTHAIGDSGNRIMLRTYANFLGGKNDLRWRVEHAQIVDPDDMEYFSKYNIIPSIQSTHCTSDMYWADERLGEERIKHAYAYQDLLDQNGWMINGTDFPVEDISPIKTFYAAVVRKDTEGWPEGGFQMENAISREDALRSITIWPAKGSFEETFKGSIEPGKVADFVILEHDIMQIDEDEMLNTSVFATYLDGKEVYKAN